MIIKLSKNYYKDWTSNLEQAEAKQDRILF